MIWTAGIGYTRFDQNAFDGTLKVNKVNPKFGIQWNITKDLLLRGAVFRFVKPPLVNNQTLKSTAVAGLNQLYR